MKIQIHETEVSSMKLITALCCVLFAGACAWCTWVSNSILSQGTVLTTVATKVDDIDNMFRDRSLTSMADTTNQLK